MRIKVIATGSSKWERFTGRWGVSFLIGEDLLFDSFGDAGVLLRNMRRFGVDSSKIKHLVLSHEHWDHTAGTCEIVSGRKDISTYICPGFCEEAKQKISSFAPCLIECEGPVFIREGVFSTGQMRGAHEGDCIFEQGLVVKSPCGLAVVTGCAHPGIINILNRVKELFPGEGIGCVFGGFHLKDSKEGEISDIISGMRDLGVARVAPTHCTGRKATEMMRRSFCGGFVKVREGETLDL